MPLRACLRQRRRALRAVAARGYLGLAPHLAHHLGHGARAAPEGGAAVPAPVTVDSPRPADVRPKLAGHDE